jgi:hypothetical protein
MFAHDGAFVLLSREDVIPASKLIVQKIDRFGLKANLGTQSKNETSKIKAMFILPRNHPKSEATFTHETADDDMETDRYVSFCDSFKYLGSLIAHSLIGDLHIDARVNEARAAQQLI